jgi:hypothetical protein
MDIGDFRLEKSVFEIRYAIALLHWDRAGSLWTEALAKWPSLKLSNAEPAKTVFSLDSKFEMLASLESGHVIGFSPQSDLDDFSQISSAFCDIIVKQLGLTEFKRLGLRLQFSKEYASKETAAEALTKTKTIHIPEGKQFGIEPVNVMPQYSLRWEGKTTGVTIRNAIETRRIDFDPPLGIDEIKPVHVERNVIVHDVDYFTISAVPLGKVNVLEWIKQGLHVVRRDSKNFLGG